MQHSRGSVLEVKAKVCCLQLLHQLVFKRQKLTISRKNLKLQQEHHNRFGSRYISSIIFKGSPTGGLTTTPNTTLLCFPHRNAPGPSLWKRSATTTDATQNRNTALFLSQLAARPEHTTPLIYAPGVLYIHLLYSSSIQMKGVLQKFRSVIEIQG